jgi:NADH-quinone oxidoreductase subunit N
MTHEQLLAMLPFMLLASASIVIILMIAARLSHFAIQVAGFLLLCLTVLAMWFVRDILPEEIPPLFIVDGFAALFTGIIIFSVGVVGLFSYIYFEEREENPKEYYILMFLATLGAAVLTISRHFVSFFIGLEILSVSLYALIAYLRNRNNAIEAGVKYLILAALTSAFLLLGMALFYMDTGQLDFNAIGEKLSGNSAGILYKMGIALMVVAIGFKLALVPFHLWAADVYQGAPSPVTSFIATASKAGVFAVLMRFSLATNLQASPFLMYVFSGIAIASMVLGNILALRQQNIKRLLAYSSIAHFGYLIVAFLPGNTEGIQSSIFYLFAYSITILAAFGIVTMLSTRMKDAEDLDLYRGLFWRNPLMAAVLAIALFSLAGIPLTAGFFAKFVVLMAGVHSALWLPVIVLVLTSVIGLYYYLRIISTLFAQAPAVEPQQKPLHPFFYFASYATLFVLMVLICVLGIFPGPAVEQIREFLMIQ